MANGELPRGEGGRGAGGGRGEAARAGDRGPAAARRERERAVTVSAEAQEQAPRLSPRAYGATAFVATLLVFVAFAHFGLSAKAFIAAYVVAVLTVLSAIDLDRRLLPDRIVLPS